MPQCERLASEPGGWEIDLATRELRADGVVVPIGSRAFEIVEMLVRSAGELVTKDHLMRRVWPGAIVEENTIQVHMSAIRKALGPDRGMLKTVSGRGYRMLGDWRIREENARAKPDALSRPRTAAHPFHTNVPIAASALIGREPAVQQLRDLLSAYRVVTLTGPGGIGKTVLAAEVVRRLLPALQSDVLMVELVSISDPGLVPTALASLLGLQLGGDVISAEAVARAIGGRKVLLVLDNCEHVIDEAAGLAETLLRTCPHTSILATSREVLRIDGEFVYQVPPLDVPSQDRTTPADVLEHSAAQLFVARTRALRADFSAREENLPTIAAICRHLDGIPLAIEFAAARAATLGPEQVLAHLDDRFGLLTVGRRTALPKHQTLRATLDWSYDLLPEPERRLLRHLAVFPAWFTLEAAGAVMRDSGANAPDFADGVSNLISKSFVTAGGAEPGRRWRLLETTRAYALEKLDAAGEANAATRRLAMFFRDTIAPAGTDLALQLSAEDVARFAGEIDNVRAALDWSFSRGGDAAIGICLTAAYAPVWFHLSLVGECRERTERALDSIAATPDLGTPLERQLQISLAVALILTMGPIDRARVAVAKARALSESVDDAEAQLRLLWAEWSMQFTIGEARAARSTAERFADVARRTGDEAAVLVGDRLMANSLHYAGDQRGSRQLFERVLDRYVAPPSRRHSTLFVYGQRALARAMLARVLWLQGLADQAKAGAQTILEAARVEDSKLTICGVLRMAVCPIALMTDDFATAEAAVVMLTELGEAQNSTLWRVVGRLQEGALLIKRGRFEAGSAIMRVALDASERTGWTIGYPESLGVFAEGLAGQGRFAEAVAATDRALDKAFGDGELWFVPELLRIKGELLLRQAPGAAATAAEDHFSKAGSLAREQGALFWELRVALSVARMHVAGGRRDAAKQCLAPVFARFTEGFETADMLAAKSLLESPAH